MGYAKAILMIALVAVMAYEAARFEPPRAGAERVRTVAEVFTH